MSLHWPSEIPVDAEKRSRPATSKGQDFAKKNGSAMTTLRNDYFTFLVDDNNFFYSIIEIASQQFPCMAATGVQARALDWTSIPAFLQQAKVPYRDGVNNHEWCSD